VGRFSRVPATPALRDLFETRRQHMNTPDVGNACLNGRTVDPLSVAGPTGHVVRARPGRDSLQRAAAHVDRPDLRKPIVADRVERYLPPIGRPCRRALLRSWSPGQLAEA